MAFVADNSVIVAWFIATQATAYTRRLAQRAKREQVMVPALWPYEFVNVLAVHRRRGILAEHHVARFIHQAERLVDIESTPQAMAAIERLAAEHELSAYDAAYLELALRLGLPLAVRDGRLREAASTAGCLAGS